MKWKNLPSRRAESSSLNLFPGSPIPRKMQPPTFVPYLAAFLASLFFTVLLYVFLKGRSSLVPKSSRSAKSEEMDPANCADLIRNQMALVQTFPHPSPKGRQSVERLSELLLGARLYFPSSKDQLSAFAGRLPGVYEDEGMLLMALMDLRKWMGANLQKPEIN